MRSGSTGMVERRLRIMTQTELKEFIQDYSLRYPRIRVSYASFGRHSSERPLWQALVSIAGTDFRAIGTSDEPAMAFAIAYAEIGMNTKAW